jgi:hypothetical protein
MKPTPRLLLACVLVLILLSACAVTARNAILGKWSNTQQGVVLEFTMDGRLRQASQGVTQELGYKFIDDTSIEINAASSSGAAPQPIKFSVAGDTLTLDLGVDATTGQSQSLQLERVK